MRIVEKICALWRTIPTNLKDAQRVMERLALDPKGGSSPALLASPLSFSLKLAAVICAHNTSISVPVLVGAYRPKTPVRRQMGAPSSPSSRSFPPARIRHERSWAPLPTLIGPPGGL